MNLEPIGYVRNDVKDRSLMTMAGTKAMLEIRPKFLDAMDGIEAGMYIWVLCYFEQADRTVLKVRAKRFSNFSKEEKGVFFRRSPDRPNPIAITAVKIEKVEGNKIFVDNIDAKDATPIVDIKPYSRGIDCIESAPTPDYSAFYQKEPDEVLARVFTKIVKHGVGEISSEINTVINLTVQYTKLSGLDPWHYNKQIETGFDGEALDSLCLLFNLKPSGFANGSLKIKKTHRPYITVTVNGKTFTAQ